MGENQGKQQLGTFGRAGDRVDHAFSNDCTDNYSYWDSHVWKLCGCPIRMSYLISAPLHSKFVEPFWHKANGLGALAALLDLLWHVGLWVVVLVMDVWVAHLPNRADDAHSIGEDEFAREIQWAATMSTGLVWAGLFVAIVFGFLGQTSGGAWPSTVSLIKGGASASIIFSTVFLFKMITMFGDGTDPQTNWNKTTTLPFLTVRQLTLWSVALKCLALAAVDANMTFGGPADRKDILNVCGLVQGGATPGATRTSILSNENSSFLPK